MTAKLPIFFGELFNRSINELIGRLEDWSIGRLIINLKKGGNLKCIVLEKAKKVLP